MQGKSYYSIEIRNFNFIVTLGQKEDLRKLNRRPFTLSDCQSEVAHNWVLLVSKELFTSSYTKHQRKTSLSQSLSGYGPLTVYSQPVNAKRK